jgi:hypothetical protein
VFIFSKLNVFALTTSREYLSPSPLVFINNGNKIYGIFSIYSYSAQDYRFWYLTIDVNESKIEKKYSFPG